MSSSTPSSTSSSRLGRDPALLALVIAPIATELPEKFNSLIWVRQGKDTLAMGNITGAMVFQSCIPTAVALIFAASLDDRSPSLRLAARVRLGRHRLHLRAAIFLPMVRTRHLTGRGPAAWGAVSTSRTWHSSWGPVIVGWV